MKSFKNQLLIIAMVLAGLSMIAIIFFNAPEPVPSNQEDPLLRVPFVPVEISTQAVPIHTRGRVSAARSHKIVSTISAEAVEVSRQLVVGAVVKKGDILVTLDDDAIRLDIAQRQATLDQMRLNLEETKVNAKVASRGDNRNSSDFARFVPQLKHANSQVAAAEESLAYAKRQLESTQVKAPIDGKIIDVFIQPGDILQASSPIATIYSMDELEVRLPLNDEQIAIIGARNAGNSELQGVVGASVILKDFADAKGWKGQIVRSDGQRGQNQLIYVVARVSGDDVYNMDGKPLLPGSFVEAIIHGQVFENVRIIPRDALQAADQIWVINDEDRVQIKQADVIYRGRERIYIQSAIPAGTRIVTGSFQRLVNDMPVSPVAQ